MFSGSRPLLTVATIAVIMAAGAPCPIAGGQDPEPLELLLGMRDAYESVSSYTMRLVKEERLKELGRSGVRFRMNRQEAEIRFRKRMDPAWQPYARDIYFDAGCRFGCPAIYREGFRDGRLDVHWGPNVRPRDVLAMKDQHHPITGLDLGVTIALVLDNVTRALEQSRAVVEYRGREVVDARATHVVSVTIDGGVTGYVACAGDDLWAVADATGQAVYVLVSENVDLELDDRLASGQVVRVPDYYGRQLLIWIDAAHGMPLQLEVYDLRGDLYERYLYADLRLNASLSDGHFR